MALQPITYRLTIDVTYDPSNLIGGVFPIASPEDWSYTNIFSSDETIVGKFVSATLIDGEL